ncbi:amino acid permease [uncultured Tateyamaria sp.]|uniref:amino acid permease n=1 Tax=uncultured Tateyamaria sp. TaxID=455651 RepID=UPI00260473CB|nr:amino acid permease [uncultured Tateyamaria sp.]
MTDAPHIAAQGAGRGAGLGLIACTALVVGNMIGSGIFLLPSALAAYGSISLAGWLVTAAGALVLALIFGRLARIAPRTGGPYAYVRDGFGDFAGFLVAWGYWIALWSGNAAIAVAFAGYLGFLLPDVGASPLASVAAALGAIWLLTWLNIRGVREAGIVQILTTGMKLFPLLALIVLGVAYIDPGNFTPVNTSEVGALSAISACAALTLWAFLGLESATVPAGDVADPERTIPLATIVGTALTALVYIGVTVVALGVIPSAELVGSNAPLALVAGAIWGAGGAMFIALGACVSTFGTLNGFTLLTGQVPLGAAQDGVFPKAFARLSTTGTPAFGLVVSNVLASGLILMSFSENLAEQFEFIVLLATLSTLFPYLLCALAELALRARGAVGPASGEMGKVILLAALGFIYSVWAIFGSGAEVVFYGFLLLMAGVPVYVWQCWMKGTDFTQEGTF